jgi:hypothetical protein
VFFLVHLGTSLNTECWARDFSSVSALHKLPTRYTLCERRSVFCHEIFLSSAMEFKTMDFQQQLGIMSALTLLLLFCTRYLGNSFCFPLTHSVFQLEYIIQTGFSVCSPVLLSSE